MGRRRRKMMMKREMHTKVVRKRMVTRRFLSVYTAVERESDRTTEHA